MITIYEVAKEAGVAPKTAARILAGQKGRSYNEERVLAAARKLGYVRNQHAANLRSGRSGLIGVIIPDIENPFYPVFFQTIHDLAVAAGYQLLLSSTFGRMEEELQALRMFEVNRVEGIILNAADGAADNGCDEVIDRFVQRGVPVIVAGRPARGLKVDEIVIRNIEGIEKATRYLVRTGHRRIGFVAGPQQVLGHRERKMGWERALAAEKIAIDPQLASFGANTLESGRVQARQLFQLPDRPTAIIAANDVLAIGVLKAASDAGLRVPQNLAVVGFDDIRFAALMSPALTTLRQPQEQIARDTVTLLLDRITGRNVAAPAQLIFDVELIIREST